MTRLPRGGVKTLIGYYKLTKNLNLILDKIVNFFMGNRNIFGSQKQSHFDLLSAFPNIFTLVKLFTYLFTSIIQK